MRRIAAWIILCMLLCGAAYAEYAPGTLMEPPREVLEHLEGNPTDDGCDKQSIQQPIMDTFP